MKPLALALFSVVFCGEAIAATAHSPLYVITRHFANDPEPMLEIGERNGRVKFARPGEEQCFSKLSGPVPCEDMFAELMLPELTAPQPVNYSPTNEPSPSFERTWFFDGVPCCDAIDVAPSPPLSPSPVPLPSTGLLLLFATLLFLMFKAIPKGTPK